MKVLFYSSYHATPHIETELEIAKGLIDGGHEVYFLQCKRELRTCFANPEHTLIGCNVCISKIKNAYARLEIPFENIISFPSVEIGLDKIFRKEEIKDIASLKQLQYKGWDIGMAVASSLISFVRDHDPDLKYFQDYLENGIKTALFVYEAGSKILDELAPDAVYLFNGRFLEVRPFMRLCEARSIKFYTHERSGILNKYLLRERSIPHSLESAHKEMEMLWSSAGKQKEEIGKKFFEDRRNRVIQGWHSYTKDQEWNKLPTNFDPLKNNIVIFNTSMDEYEGVSGFENNIYKDDNEAIEKIISSFQKDASKHFYLRVHPNLKNLRNSQIKEVEEINAKYSNLTIIRAEEDIDSYGIMEKANKILTFSSTMGIESVYWNKPVILLGRAFYEQLNCLYKPISHQEVISLIENDNLSPFNQQEALKYGYWCLNMGIPFQHYTPTAVTKGKFENKRITPHLFWRAFYIMQNKLKNAKI